MEQKIPSRNTETNFENQTRESYHNLDLDVYDETANVYDPNSHTLLYELPVESIFFNNQKINGNVEILKIKHLTYVREKREITIHV